MSKSGNETKETPATPPATTIDQHITKYKIHPGLGIGRIGNSPSEFYVGPLSPGEVPNPQGGFKDKMGRIKRQAAEFRVFGYNKDGVAVKEITADDADIIWNVHLVNRKAEHHQFAGRWWQSQYPEWYSDDPNNPADCSLVVDVFWITAVSRIGNELWITFPTLSGRSYVIQGRAVLAADGWADVPGTVNPGNGTDLQVVIPNAFIGPQRFYRAKQLP